MKRAKRLAYRNKRRLKRLRGRKQQEHIAAVTARLLGTVSPIDLETVGGIQRSSYGFWRNRVNVGAAVAKAWEEIVGDNPLDTGRVDIFDTRHLFEQLEQDGSNSQQGPDNDE
jgi:hypothetical protein